MIAHLILMNLNDSEDSTYVAEQVLSLTGKIPGLSEVTGGTSVISGSTTWNLGFIMMFKNENSVLSYQAHPEHVTVGVAIKPLIKEMATCDLPLTDSFLSSAKK